MSNPNTFASLIDPLADKNQFQIIDRGTSSEVFKCKERVLIPQTTKFFFAKTYPYYTSTIMVLKKDIWKLKVEKLWKNVI